MRKVPVAYIRTYAYQPIVAISPDNPPFYDDSLERRLSIFGNTNQSPASSVNAVHEKPTKKPLFNSPPILNRPLKFLAHLQQISLNIIKELGKIRGPLQDAPSNSSAPIADPTTAIPAPLKDEPSKLPASTTVIPATEVSSAPAVVPASIATETSALIPVTSESPASAPLEAEASAQVANVEPAPPLAARSITGRSKDSIEAITDPLTHQYFSNYLTPNGMPLQQVQFVPCMCPMLAGFPTPISANSRSIEDLDFNNFSGEFADLKDLNEHK